MRTVDIEPGRDYFVVAPYEGPRGKARVVRHGVTVEEARQIGAHGQIGSAATVLVKFAQGYAARHPYVVRPGDVIRAWPDEA